MADFVNYNKRSIDLPPGCMDMMDVLRAQEEARGGKAAVKAATNKWIPLEVKRHQQARGPLSAMEEHVQKLYQSGERFVALRIRALDWRLEANLLKREGKIWASVRFTQGSKYELMVRDFLSKRDLKLPPASMPSAFKMPVDETCDLTPLPADAAGVTALLAGLFYEVGLKDEAEMRYNTTFYKWPEMVTGTVGVRHKP